MQAMASVAAENEEALRAWNGVLFDRFLKFRHLFVGSVESHSDEAMRAYPPPTGGRALDIGCGFGDTTMQIAELVGDGGSALGVDVAPRFIEQAREDARQAGVANVSFEVADVQATSFDETFDCAFSRFGTMFFANPVAALRNVRAALRPDGRLTMVVWRRREDNPWLHEAELVVKPLIDEPEETDEARCGPGPFSMANADTVSQMLLGAGFDEIELRRCDRPFRIGGDLEEAVEFNLAIGPAAEVVRLAGDEGEAMRPYLGDLLRPALQQFSTPEGIVAASSTWIVSAVAV
jgi:ubiquinone/menaquinone biosynthesis C-methylase UbiE